MRRLSAAMGSGEVGSRGWENRRRGVARLRPLKGGHDCACCLECRRPAARSWYRGSDCASGRAIVAVAVRQAAGGRRRHLAKVNNYSREAASDVTRRAGRCKARGQLWGGRGRDYLRDGSMVPESMMPFPMPPFDMICMGCCTCTEYIQAARERPSSREASVERREAQGGRAQSAQGG